MTDILQHNREAWNAQSRWGESPWCQPVEPAVIDAARRGEWSIILTPNIAVPRDWFGEIAGKTVLCLASGGGQQAPVLAAAGANVTSFDNADEQLAKDALVAEREGLKIELVRGDMADLSQFSDGHFDLIVHPVANVFAEDPLPVWRECYRVLRTPGRLLSGFMNPDFFLFDHDAIEAGGRFEVKYSLPYSDVDDLTPEQLKERVETAVALEFSHSLDTQIGGQLAAGFVIAGFYEDRWNDRATPLDRHMPTSMATLALKTDLNTALKT